MIHHGQFVRIIDGFQETIDPAKPYAVCINQSNSMDGTIIFDGSKEECLIIQEAFLKVGYKIHPNNGKHIKDASFLSPSGNKKELKHHEIMRGIAFANFSKAELEDIKDKCDIIILHRHS